MYDLSWGDESLWRRHGGDVAIPPPAPDVAVSAAGLLLWEEHCIECSVPDCYSACRLYVARKDRKCARFVYGIQENPQVQGLLPFGADILFRRWGKLEARCIGLPRMAPVDRVRRYARRQRRIERAVNVIGDALQIINPKRRVNGVQTFLRNKWFERQRAPRGDADGFYVKFFYPGAANFALQLEVHQDRPIFRDVISVHPGWNERVVPIEAVRIEPNKATRILFVLGNDETARLVFTWLDFVRLANVHESTEPARTGSAVGRGRVVECGGKIGPVECSTPRSAGKIKCVAWDLDNTLWEGVIGEVGAANVVPNERALSMVQELDRRGILQTVASKNTYEVAWPKVEALGLADYMLYPAIHWGPKSESLKTIAAELNINVDACALIDDSAFERAEVQAALPQVRVYDVAEIGEMLGRDEFDLPLTEVSQLRRLSYLAEAQRKRVGSGWKDDITGFLRSCELVLSVRRPVAEERMRCLELLQRTNQLNLSTRRYSEAELDMLLASPTVECFSLRCEDRFGDYGLVGFAAIDVSTRRPRLVDFVLSCRVAKKMIEETFIRWYAREAQRRGADRLLAVFIPTERNQPLREALQKLPFEMVRTEGVGQLLEFAFDGPIDVPDVVRIEAP